MTSVRTYTVVGLCNRTTRAVLVAGVVIGKPACVMARRRTGEWGQWERFAEVVKARDSSKAEAAVVQRFTNP